MTNVVSICGSLRKGSYNRMVMAALPSLVPSGMSIKEAPPYAEVPLYNADIQNSSGFPAAATALADAIRAADGVIFCTPEYNFSLPGGLKNAIDWASRPPPSTPLRGKPCGIMGASGGMSGTMRMQYHLRQIFVFTQTQVMLTPEIFVRNAAQVFDASGKLTDDATRKLLAQHAEALVAWTRKVR